MVDGSLADEFASRPDLFRPELTLAARRWFIDRLVSYVRAQKPPDERAAVLQRLKDAKALAQRCVDTLARYAKRADAGVTVLALAPVAAYGAIGLHPDVFLGGDNSDLLEFVAVRRCRAVDRMRWDVSKEFVDPGQVIQRGGLLDQAPSMHAKDFRTVLSTAPGRSGLRYLFVPSAAPGAGAPGNAVENLLKPARSADLTPAERRQGIDLFRTQSETSDGLAPGTSAQSVPGSSSSGGMA